MLAAWLIGSALAADPTLEELLTATDDTQRGYSSIAVITMQVKTANYERTIKMQAWSKGKDDSLVKILAPEKDAGVATLKVGENLWNYLPKVDRTMKVPAGMMSGSWMGSHFSNDDLVHQSRFSRDYECAFTKRPSDADSGGNYTVACTPHPDAPVVWGQVVLVISPDKIPVKVDYFDEKKTLVRTMDYSDVKDVSGHKTPMTMMLTPHDKPGEFTKMTFESLQYGASLPDSMFTLESLK